MCYFLADFNNNCHAWTPTDDDMASKRTSKISLSSSSRSSGRAWLIFFRALTSSFSLIPIAAPTILARWC